MKCCFLLTNLFFYCLTTRRWWLWWRPARTGSGCRATWRSCPARTVLRSWTSTTCRTIPPATAISPACEPRKKKGKLSFILFWLKKNFLVPTIFWWKKNFLTPFFGERKTFFYHFLVKEKLSFTIFWWKKNFLLPFFGEIKTFFHLFLVQEIKERKLDRKQKYRLNFFFVIDFLT